MKKAVRIEVEAIDGAGKTTAVKHLVESLRNQGYKVLETREVGSPHVPGMQQLREIILDPTRKMEGTAMEFVFAAMRIESQKFYDSVENDYDFIVSDRGWFSHLAYTDHNVSRSFTMDFYYNIVKPLTKLPDFVLYLGIEPDVAASRRTIRAAAVDVIEAKGNEFQKKVSASFDEHMEFQITRDENETSIIPINANLDREAVKHQINDFIKLVTAPFIDASGVTYQ